MLSKYFYIFKDETSEKYLLYLDEFLTFLRKHKNPSDKLQHVKKCNVIRELERSGEKLYNVNDKEAISLTFLLKYTFYHCEQSGVLKNISVDIEKLLLFGSKEKKSQDYYHRTCLELYNEIALSQLPIFESVEKLSFDESAISYLVNDHKQVENFTEHQWKKICHFEFHFSKDYDHDHDTNYENLVQKKWTSFERMKSLDQHAKTWLQISKQHILSLAKRKETYEKLSNVVLRAYQKHLPAVIDHQLQCLLEETFPGVFQSVTIVDNNDSKTANCLDVIIEANIEFRQQNFTEICEQIRVYLTQHHRVNIRDILFFSTNAISEYKSASGKVARFELKDDIQTHKVVSDIYQHHFNQDSLFDIFEEHENLECGNCFQDVPSNPLSIENFNIRSEWLMETPLETQVLLDGFINMKGLRLTKFPERFLDRKYQVLYGAYDTLLNCFTQKHIGILQLANSSELLMEHKSLNTVFSVTSDMGATTSLKTAENLIQKKVDSDQLYYNTYIKKYTLSYESAAGMVQNENSMKEDCHVILMFDNLVRTTTPGNPGVGVVSGALRSLPITVQGLPMDSLITESWHSDECDGTDECICKKVTELKKEEIDEVLLPSEIEKFQLDSLTQLCTWGYTDLWKQMPGELKQHKNGLDEDDDYNDEMEDELPEESALMSPLHVAATNIGNEASVQTPIESLFDLPENEDELQLSDILRQVRKDLIEENSFDEDFEEMEKQYEASLTELNESMGEIKLTETTNNNQSENILGSFGFHKFKVPPLLCKHPPPATGRDDDINNVKQIVDDVMLKLGYKTGIKKLTERILCGADQKIGNNILRLMSMNEKYSAILPEFPLLHLRKSKITILFSSYNDAGLLQLLQYMRDDDRDEWSKLVSAAHIDMATRNVKRIGQALHLAFLIEFAATLEPEDRAKFIRDMENLSEQELATEYNDSYVHFLNEGCEKNATFCLHVDMMSHCDEIIAVQLAERLGGPEGYSLLLSVVKHSLPFAFINGASSYAPFCTKLLYQHYRSGPFHQKMKQCLYTTPFGKSSKNFASDTKRELDHLEAVKSFRSGSTISSVTSRLSLIDSLNAIHEARTRTRTDSESCEEDLDELGWPLSNVDKQHIYRTTSLILRCGGLSLEEITEPKNVYAKKGNVLPVYILDKYSVDVGKFLLRRFVVREKMFGLCTADEPKIEDFDGHVDVKNRAKKSKSITMKRIGRGKTYVMKTERQEKEEKRQKALAKEIKQLNCLSSEMNACQALVTPDCAKPKVQKSTGMKTAIEEMLNVSADEAMKTRAAPLLNQNSLPNIIGRKVKIATMEFAGVKFTSTFSNGKQYLAYVEHTVLQKLFKQIPNVEKVIICEEKYSYTPDDFKAATRNQRTSVRASSIDHLRTGSNIISDTAFKKDAITKTAEGKSLASLYVAENIKTFRFSKHLRLVMDSELLQSGCSCSHYQDGTECRCLLYSIPVEYTYSTDGNAPQVRKLENIHQRKGEGEMSQVDWLINSANEMRDGDIVLSYVTSGDIDAIYIHLYAVSKHWPRKQDQTFRNEVIVVLCKPENKLDIYNITGMIELLEMHYKDNTIGMKMALILCMGGNDFLPKIHMQSHAKIMLQYMSGKYPSLLLYSCDKLVLNTDSFVDFIKELFFSNRMKRQNINMSFDEIRSNTIGKREPSALTFPGSRVTNNPQRWLPPETAIHRLAQLVELQIDYLDTVGRHEATLPNFLDKQCLRKNESGEVEYDFGPEANINVSHIPSLKTKQTSTPQKGQRKKRQKTSNKTSTPRRK